MTATIMCTYMYVYRCIYVQCICTCVLPSVGQPWLLQQRQMHPLLCPRVCVLCVCLVCVYINFRHKYQCLSNITEKVSLRNKITPKWHMLEDPVGERFGFHWSSVVNFYIHVYTLIQRLIESSSIPNSVDRLKSGLKEHYHQLFPLCWPRSLYKTL